MGMTELLIIGMIAVVVLAIYGFSVVCGNLLKPLDMYWAGFLLGLFLGPIGLVICIVINISKRP